MILLGGGHDLQLEVHRALAQCQPERDDVLLLTTKANHPVVVALVVDSAVRVRPRRPDRSRARDVAKSQSPRRVRATFAHSKAVRAPLAADEAQRRAPLTSCARDCAAARHV